MISNEDENLQEESSSRHLLGALEDLLKRSDPTSIIQKRNRYQSKSLDDLLLYRIEKHSKNDEISDLTRTEFDLSNIDHYDDGDLNEFSLQRSRSAPASPTKIYEKELAAFIDCNQTQYQTHPTDNFIYNIDLSDSQENPHPINSKLAIFFEDDEPTINLLLSSSHIKNCLTIEEENEEELEQLRRDNEQEYSNPIFIPTIILSNENDTIENENMNNIFDRLSTIYESPSPQTELNDNTSDKLIVYDFEKTYSFPVIHSPIIPSRSSPILYPIETNQQIVSSHVKKMRVIQSTSTSLSDFISSSTPMSTTLQNAANYDQIRNIVHQSLINCSSIENNERRPILTNGLLSSHCATNPIPRRKQQTILSDSSSSSDGLSSSEENLLSRSDFLLQHDQTISLQRKSSSLKSISLTSNILYPIDFQYPNQLKQYRKNLTELSLIKTNLVDIESRLNEAIREEQIEQALIEGEHELVFKQILDASEIDQENLRKLYKNLQGLIERIMTDKTILRDEIEYTKQILCQLERELHDLEQNYRSTDEKIIKKKQLIHSTRQKYEDLEFQFMEFETRCESELEQAEKHFENEQKLVSQNGKIRQVTLRELDHQQNIIYQQATIEREKLEREKLHLKTIFKQKKIEINQFEDRFHREGGGYPSTSLKNDEQQLDEMKDRIEKINLNKISFFEQRFNDKLSENTQVKLRDKNRLQERPLTRYLPIRSADFDLCAHIESAGHQLNSVYVTVTPTSCRGYLYKMGGMKFKTWNRRWFVFDRQCHSLCYYQDKNQRKLRGSISFQSILEVYVDHLQSMSLRSPEPREATFIVKTIGKSYYLVAPTIESMRIWIDVLITGAEGNIFARN